MSAAPTVTMRVFAPLDMFVTSPTQPRKRFAGIAELAASIAELGVLDDVHARMREDGKLELICGERRLRAARELGLEAIPFQIRDLTDEEVIRVQLAEAREREDLHPLEEAEAFDLARSRGLSVEDLRNGRPASYVYRRLALVQLSKKAHEAFFEGKLTEGAAQILARLTDRAEQDRVLDEAQQLRGHEHGAIRVQDIAFYVDRAVRRLKDAPWKLDDPDLHGGACTTCPKRTQAQAQLFEETTSADDACTDRACFEAKRAEHSEQLVELAKKSGAKALSKSETKALFPYEHASNYEIAKAGYVDMDGRGDVGALSPTKKWREVLGDRTVPRFVAKNPRSETVHELVRLEDVKRVLKAEPRKGDPKAPAKKPSSSSTKSSGKSTALKPKKVDDAILVREAKSVAGDRIITELGRAIAAGDLKPIDAIRYLAHDVATGLGYHEALERRGLKTDEKALGAFLAKANAAELLAFGVEITIREQFPIETDRKVWHGLNVRELIEAAGVDWLAIEQEEIAIARATPGTCRVCGCTEENACPEGCSWVDESKTRPAAPPKTLCSSCDGVKPAKAKKASKQKSAKKPAAKKPAAKKAKVKR
jgi:ParB/RepB/Spo0J family partition protein